MPEGRGTRDRAVVKMLVDAAWKQMTNMADHVWAHAA